LKKQKSQPTHPELAEEGITEESTALTGSIWMQSKEILLDLIWLWLILMITAAIGIIIYLLKKKR
jgi:hypothetical protein